MSELVMTSEPFAAVGDAAATWVAEALTGSGIAEQVSTLHVATPDSGAREALAFWSAAQATGLRLASPAAFPWTLSTSVTGRISVALEVTGGCTTYVGDDEAWEEALLSAAEDAASGATSLAVRVEGLDPPDPHGGSTRVRVTARRVSPG